MKRRLEKWKLGKNRAESDYLFELVKKGLKVATSYLYDETFVMPSQYSILTNWNGTDEVQLEITRCYIVPFKDVPERQAIREGEGLCTLEEWKIIHKDFFTKELAEKGKEFTEDTLIVCEEFCLFQWAKKW